MPDFVTPVFEQIAPAVDAFRATRAASVDAWVDTNIGVAAKARSRRKLGMGGATRGVAGCLRQSRREACHER